jgi:hypothetical protein
MALTDSGICRVDDCAHSSLAGPVVNDPRSHVGGHQEFVSQRGASMIDRLASAPKTLPARAWRRAALAAICVSAVSITSGCGGGSEGGNVSIGSGQSPDPVAVDFPIFYVKRPLSEDAAPGDARDLLVFDVGAELHMLDRGSASAPDRNLTEELLGELGDVRDLDVSWDGRKVVFAMRGPMLENVAPEDQPTWNVWEYDLDTDTMRRVIASDIVAEEGQDRFPHYVPDGRIVFASTRQRQSRAILLDEGKPQFAALEESGGESAFVLHVMRDDGSDLHQISFNQSHDRDPFVLPDGMVAYTRWDHGPGIDEMNLYRVRPDGAGLELLYGAQSHATGSDDSIVQFLSPQPAPDGSVIAVLRPYTDTDDGGDLVRIDVAQYVENTQALRDDVGVLAGPAQARVLDTDIQTIPGPSPGGRYAGAFPLWDGTGRFLVSWSQCRLVIDARIVPCTADNLADPAAEPADPIYGLFLYDPTEATQQPLVSPEEGFAFDAVIAAAPRTVPAVVLDGVAGVDLDADLVAAGEALLNIDSFYDVDGVDVTPDGIVAMRDPALTAPDERPARFLRIEKAVSQPDDDVVDVPGTAFGPIRSLGMREILGYAPIEPDGSVRIRLPANVAVSLSALDANGRRIGARHSTWLQFTPGEVRDCQGCHAGASGLSHGRNELFAAVNPGAPTTGEPFPNTDPALYADFGETMAETRSRISCNTDCAALDPSVDIVFEDVWTDEATAGRPRAAPFEYRYNDLDTPAPVAPSCLTEWTAACRIVINYLDHIQPLWELPRQVLDVDGVTVLADRTCVTCHTTAAALDLTSTADAAEPDHAISYSELLFTEGTQDLSLNILVAGSAVRSGRFFDRFAPAGAHDGWLSPAELRLISEWVDIGAQYYNNPFAVPVN